MTTQTTQTQTVTFKRLLDIHKGFQLICAGSFPNAVSRARAAFQMGSLRPALDAYDAAIKPLGERESKLIEIVDDVERAQEFQAIKREADALMLETVTIPKPTKMLVDADLPREKGKGDANGLATVLLAPEFYTLTDPDAEAKPEPDEA